MRSDERGRRTVLVVEDEPTIAEIVSRYLERADYETSIAADGLAALEMVGRVQPDLIVLDLVMPGIDGLEVLRRIRAEPAWRIAVILLTAKGEEAHRISGLRLGADDYVIKPFSPNELVSRVDAVARRVDTPPVPEVSLTFEGLVIEPSARRVRVDGTEVLLTQREFDLLAFLAAHPARSSRAGSSWTTCGASRSTPTPRRSPSTSAGCGRSSSGTRGCRNGSRPSGVSDTGSRDEKLAPARGLAAAHLLRWVV